MNFTPNQFRGCMYECRGLNCVVILNTTSHALISPFASESQFTVPISELGRLLTLPPQVDQ
jgi:hypothetical protein